NRLQREHNFYLNGNDLPKPASITSKHLEHALRVNAHLPLNNTARTHLVLAVGPPLKVGQGYRGVFGKILGGKMSPNPVAHRSRTRCPTHSGSRGRCPARPPSGSTPRRLRDRRPSRRWPAACRG